MAGGTAVARRVGRRLTRGALPMVIAVLVVASARPANDPTPRTTEGNGGIRLVSAQGVTTPALTHESLDFVDSLHGFAVNAVPALNDGGFAGSPSLLLSTVDGGKSWSSRPFPIADGVVADISFVSATTGWAASFFSPGGGPGQQQLILATTNAGVTWTSEPLPSSLAGVVLRTLRFADAQHGWAGGMYADDTGKHPVLLATVDGGKSWSMQGLPAGVSIGEIDSLSLSSNTLGWAGGNTDVAPFVISTKDGGSTWVSQALPSSFTTLNAVTSLGTNAWAVGSTTSTDASVASPALKSSNGGAWQPESVPSGLQLLNIAFSGTASGWAVAIDNTGATSVLHTKNGGSTWTGTAAPSPVPSASAVAAVAGAGAWVLGVGTCRDNAFVAKTTDGTAWVTQLAMSSIPAQLSDPSFPTSTTGFLIAKNCGYHLVRTLDAGRTWTPTSPFPTPFQALAATFPTRSHGWVIGDNPDGVVLYATDDGAASWKLQVLPTGFGSFNAPAFGDASHGWIAGEDQNSTPEMVATINGGSSWITKSIPPDIGYLAAAAAVGSSSVWAVGSDSAASGGHAMAITSSDGGATWTVELMPPGLQSLQRVSFIDTLHGWAIGYDANFNSSLVATTDGGASWHLQTTAPPNVGEVSFASPSVGWATAPQGIFATTDGGATWTQKPAPAQFQGFGGIHALSTASLIGEGVDAAGFVGIARSSNSGSSWTHSAIFDPAWLAASATSTASGSTVTLTGHGFDANEVVKIRWTSTSGSVLASVTSDSSGAFMVSFAVPSTTAGAHKVYAVGQLSLSAPYVSLTVT